MSERAEPRAATWFRDPDASCTADHLARRAALALGVRRGDDPRGNAASSDSSPRDHEPRAGDEAGGPGPARWILSPDATRARLAHGASLTEEVWAPAAPGPLLLIVEAITERGETITASARLESVDDPERAALRAECVAAGGQWGPHRMMGHESCDRPTRDAGQRCTSDADCEGPCIESGTEPLAGAAPPGAEVPACGAGRAPRLVVGRCHDRSLGFGCHARLSDVTIECVGPFPRRAHTVCVTPTA
jgi:hypothetical protein